MDHEEAKMRKGLWSPDEDEKLRRCIAMYKKGSWSDIAKRSGLQRCGKSCRRRWVNHLRPGLKRGRFTPLEIKLVLELHRTLGNRWSEIAAHLAGRTDNDVKNLWNTQIKRRLNNLPLHQQSLSVDFHNLLHKPPPPPALWTTQEQLQLADGRIKPILPHHARDNDNGTGVHNLDEVQPQYALKAADTIINCNSNMQHGVQSKGAPFTPYTATPLTSVSNAASDASTVGCSDSGPVSDSPYNELLPDYTIIGTTPRHVEVAEICAFALPKECVQLEDWFLPLLSDVDVLTSGDGGHGPPFMPMF